MLIRDANAAFRNAITSGRLTDLSAPLWMYMYSKDEGDEGVEFVDYFKNIHTREYMLVFASDVS